MVRLVNAVVLTAVFFMVMVLVIFMLIDYFEKRKSKKLEVLRKTEEDNLLGRFAEYDDLSLKLIWVLCKKRNSMYSYEEKRAVEKELAKRKKLLSKK